MTGQCCRTAASVLPAAGLVLLPKCPLCLAAWLTFATGVAIPEAGVAWVRGLLVVFWIAAVMQIVRRRLRQTPVVKKCLVIECHQAVLRESVEDAAQGAQNRLISRIARPRCV